MGPDGDDSGTVVAEGTPEEVAKVPASHTGRYLAKVLSGQSLTGGYDLAAMSQEGVILRVSLYLKPCQLQGL